MSDEREALQAAAEKVSQSIPIKIAEARSAEQVAFDDTLATVIVTKAAAEKARTTPGTSGDDLFRIVQVARQAEAQLHTNLDALVTSEVRRKLAEEANPNV